MFMFMNGNVILRSSMFDIVDFPSNIVSYISEIQSFFFAQLTTFETTSQRTKT